MLGRLAFARLVTALAVSLGLLVQCSDSSESGAPAASGGALGSGGSTATGATGGALTSGGRLASTGGAAPTSSGGRSAAGGAAGGVPGTGGRPEGGSSALGGSPAGGGTLANGGAAPSGGRAQAGEAGATTGGSSTTAGSAGAGGASGAPALPKFLLGADISSIQEAVDGGTRYADTDGTEKSLLEILKAHGFNSIRLRAFVEPNAEYGYARGSPGGNCAKTEAYCDTAHTIEFAKEIKAAGMSFLLDLHYSDTWADPGKQIIPASFRDAASIAELAAKVSDYTTDILTKLVAAGARPDMVQVGNEITPGMLIHVPGQNTDCWGNQATQSSLGGSTSNWSNLSTLLKAGIAAVRAVDPSILVMLHLENTDDLAGARWWVQNALDRDVKFDVLGLSCYTAFQGQPSTWRSTFNALASEFPELKFVIAEYNPERTAANEIMRDLPDGRGLGTYFWEPTQSGSWGDSMFTTQGGVQRANSADFAEFDALKADLGL